MQKILFILDPGHGINTPGKRSPVWGDGRQLFEHEFNKDVVNSLKNRVVTLDSGQIISDQSEGRYLL